MFRAAERLARKLRKSRSQLYAEAIAEYVGVPRLPAPVPGFVNRS